MGDTRNVPVATPAQITSWVHAWQTIFLVSCIPGFILFLGAFRLKESARWLYRKGIAFEKKASELKLFVDKGEVYLKSLKLDIIAVFSSEKNILFPYYAKAGEFTDRA